MDFSQQEQSQQERDLLQRARIVYGMYQEDLREEMKNTDSLKGFEQGNVGVSVWGPRGSGATTPQACWPPMMLYVRKTSALLQAPSGQK